MSLSNARGYFKERIAVVDSSLIEWRDAFNIENIPSTLLESRYHLLLGPSVVSKRIDRHIEDIFSVTLTLWKKGFNDVPSAVDALLNTALCIRADIVSPINIESYVEPILDVTASEITIEEISANNDNIVQIKTVYEARIATNID